MTGRFGARPLATVLVALLVAIAGCGGLGGGDGGAGTTTAGESTAPATTGATTGGTIGPTTSGTTASTAAPTTTTTAPTTTDDGERTTTTERPGQVTSDYRFSEGERYRYDVVGDVAAFSWEVTDVSGEEVTVEVVLVSPQGNRTTTLVGRQTDDGNTVFRRAAQESSSRIFASLHAGVLITRDRSLTVGNSWTVTPADLPTGTSVDWESASVEVTGTDSYAGIDCTNVSVTPAAEDATTSTFCVNRDYPFALAAFSEGGGSVGSVVLVEAER